MQAYLTCDKVAAVKSIFFTLAKIDIAAWVKEGKRKDFKTLIILKETDRMGKVHFSKKVK